MLTVHIAGKPERGVQRCFRCNRVLTDNSRAATVGRSVVKYPPGTASGDGLKFWEPGAFVGISHDTNPVYSAVLERDALSDDPEERACECPPADVDVRPVECYQ